MTHALKRWGVGGALAVLLVCAAVAGFRSTMDGSQGPRLGPGDCPEGVSATRISAAYLVTGQAGRVVVSGTVEVSLRGVSNEWMSHVTTDILALCGFANSVSGEQSFYDGPQLQLTGYEKGDADGLELHYKSVGIEPSDYYTEAENLQPLDTSSAVSAPSSVVKFNLGNLKLDINLCRATTSRLACGDDTPTNVMITVSDSIFKADRDTDAQPVQDDVMWPVIMDPSPTHLESDANAKTTIYRWQSADPAQQIRFEATTRTLLSQLRSEMITVGSKGVLLVTFYWGRAVAYALPLLALAAALAVNRRVVPKTDNGSILAGLALVAMSLSVDFESNYLFVSDSIRHLDQLWLGLLWAAAVWASAASYRPALLTVSAVGVLVLMGGYAFSGLAADSMRAVGLLAVAAAVGISLMGRLKHGLRLLPPLPAIVDREPSQEWRPSRSLVGLRVRLQLAAALGLAAGSALLVGYSGGRQVGYGSIDGVAVAAQVIGLNLLTVLISVVSLFMLAGVAEALYRPGASRESDLRPPTERRLLLTLLVAVVATPAAPAWAGLTLPVWLVTWPLLYLVVKETALPTTDVLGSPAAPEGAGLGTSHDRAPHRSLQLRTALRAERSYAELVKADHNVSSGAGGWERLHASKKQHDLQYPIDPVKEFLAHGPRFGWAQNAQWAALLGCVLAVLPVGYYAWESAQTVPDRLTSSNGGLYVVAGLLVQVARWVGISYVFGAIYACLPTRIGITKGAVLAAAWSAGALTIEILARWLGLQRGNVWLFNSLLVFLFLVTLGFIYDATTVKRARGSVRRLSELYRLTTIRARLAFAGPLVVAVVGLIAEVQAGAGTSTVQLFVDALVKSVPGVGGS